MFTDTFETPRVLPPLRIPQRYLWALLIGVSAAVVTLATTATDAFHAVPASSSITGLVTSFGHRHSHNGRYSAQVISAPSLGVGSTQNWTMHLEHRGRRVAHASVSALAWMPEDRSQPRVRAMVRYVGDGNYRISGFALPRAGWWNLALVLSGRHGTDSVAFNVILPERK